MPTLLYATDALTPHMSAETLKFHHGKHLRTYVDNLNKLVEGTPYEDLELEEIVCKASGSLFNNAAQVWNHIFFFDTLIMTFSLSLKQLLALMSTTSENANI